MAVATELQHCAECVRFFISHVCGSCLGSSLEPVLLSPSSEMDKPRQKWFVRMI